MTSTAATPATRRTPSSGVVLIAVVIAAIGAFLLGRATAPDNPLTWESGRADVVGQKVTIETSNWTYGFEGPVGWIDSAGSRASGFPACLATGTGTEVRFAWVPVAELGTREVVAIHC
jgi:hypothetical protein